MGKLTWIFILINVVIFEIVFSMPKELLDLVFQTFSFSSTNMLELWRWPTSLFLHAGASHLFFNMLGLYFFGKIVEEEVGYKWWLVIYFISGLLGNFAYGITSANSAVGASGCIFGLMGAAMLLNPTKMVRLYIFPLPLGVIAVLYAVVETMLSFYTHTTSSIAHIAHVGGLIAGSLFAFFYDKKRAMKGVFVLILFAAVLIFLGPVIGIIIGLGGLVLDFLDLIFGFFLYGFAHLFSWVWYL